MEYDVSALARAIATGRALLNQHQQWRRDALCLEHGEVSFHPTRGESAAPAKAVCSACLVRDACRRELEADTVLQRGGGIWGGSSPADRRKAR
jgi:WhiB family redox-sensing transcriptional regulator